MDGGKVETHARSANKGPLKTGSVARLAPRIRTGPPHSLSIDSDAKGSRVKVDLACRKRE